MKLKRISLVFLLVVVPLVIVGILDYVSSHALSWSFLYLIPIAFASLLTGRTGGIICCICCSGVYLLAELAGRDPVGLGIALWNTGMRLGILLVIGILLPVAIEAIKEAYRDH